jgi:hypothetical protein
MRKMQGLNIEHIFKPFSHQLLRVIQYRQNKLTVGALRAFCRRSIPIQLGSSPDYFSNQETRK